MLEEDKLLLVVAFSLNRSEQDGLARLKEVISRARDNGYRVIGLSASGEDLKSEINENFGLDLDWYFSDETTLKTISRSNPGLVLVRSGTIVEKKHWSDAEEMKF